MRKKLCASPGCWKINNEDTRVSFNSFPTNAIRGVEATKHFVVCELHFSEDCFNPQSVQGSKPQLRRTAVPNQHLILIKPDENAGNAQKKRGVLMGIPAPGQIPDSVAVEGLK